MAALYHLQGREAPWGDYGHILLHGMSGWHEWEKGEPLPLARTGPFIPPISFPWPDVVLTDDFRHRLESSGLTGLAFGPVLKERIVRLEWEKWDHTAPEPRQYPREGEPENYVLGRRHSPVVAEQLGTLWELCLDVHASVERIQVGPSSIDVTSHIVLSTWDGTDFFVTERHNSPLVSEKAKAWLKTTVPEWVHFRPARTRPNRLQAGLFPSSPSAPELG